MVATTHKTFPWLVVAGQMVAALLAACVFLVASLRIYVVTGLLQRRHVQILTPEPSDDPFCWSIHFLGATVKDSESLFAFLCLLLLLPSLAIGVFVWRHFGQRWKGHHEL
jgi:hypothetical protein